MTDKQILQQLKELKKISLDSEIKKSQRDVLFSQISSQKSSVDSDKVFANNLFSFKNVFSLVTRPALVVAGVFVFLVGALVLGSGFYKDSKPNDSLYIARIISEKARLNTTFSQSQRDRLAMEFANNHARDIAIILMDPGFNIEENRERVEKLSEDFRSEINKVRSKIKISEDNLSDISEDENTESKEGKDSFVFSAGDLKEGEGVEIHIPEKDNDDVVITSVSQENDFSTSSEDDVDLEEVKTLESQIDRLNEELELESDQDYKKSKKEILEEIELLFDAGKYEEVILKLESIK
jgi:hypothetical protein